MREGYFLSNQLPGQRFDRALRFEALVIEKLLVGAKCTGNGGVFDTAQLWTIGGSTPPPPSNPCGMPCNDNWECDSNKCGVGGTRCAGHCWKKGF